MCNELGPVLFNNDFAKSYCWRLGAPHEELGWVGIYYSPHAAIKFVLQASNMGSQPAEQPFKRRWGSSKRKKKQKELIANQQAAAKSSKVPESSFTRTISNPEEVMKRKRQQKLAQKLQQINRDGSVETGRKLFSLQQCAPPYPKLAHCVLAFYLTCSVCLALIYARSAVVCCNC